MSETHTKPALGRATNVSEMMTPVFCVLIPAYNPDHHLLDLIDNLLRRGVENIIVVDDGSDQQSRWVFERIDEIPQCRLLIHAENFGKGRALKTGLNFLLLNMPHVTGVITADADGQHTAEDILKVAQSLQCSLDTLVLGVRAFDDQTPWRSLLGNKIARGVIALLFGLKISDTQTGLRGIPAVHIPVLLRQDGDRYEYEMNMLLALKRAGIDFKEEKISTIYINNNSSSHFKPVFDSMRIFFILVKRLSMSGGAKDHVA